MNNNYNSNTVVKQDFAVVKQVDGRAAHMTDTTRHPNWQSTPPPPLPDHAGSIPVQNAAKIRYINFPMTSVLTKTSLVLNLTNIGVPREYANYRTLLQ